MQERTERRFSWGYFLLGILFVAASFLAFFNPLSNIEAFVIAYAALAIVNGIWMIASRDGMALRVVAGIFNILLGIFMLLNISLAITTVPYIFAIWFIVDSVFRLLTLGRVLEYAGWGYFWFSLVLNVMGVVVGIMLLFQPVVALLTFSFMIGFYLMLVGILCIVGAFSRDSYDT